MRKVCSRGRASPPLETSVPGAKAASARGVRVAERGWERTGGEGVCTCAGVLGRGVVNVWTLIEVWTLSAGGEEVVVELWRLDLGLRKQERLDRQVIVVV